MARRAPRCDASPRRRAPAQHARRGRRCGRSRRGERSSRRCRRRGAPAQRPHPVPGRPRRRGRPIGSGCRAARAAGCRASPTPGSACPAGRPVPHPGTISRAACLGRARGSPPLPPRGSFFESLLCCGIGLRMTRTHAQSPVAEHSQILADGPLVHRHPEGGFNPASQVPAPPAHNSILLRVGTSLHPGRDLRHLGEGEPARPRRRPPVHQAREPFGIVPVHPVPQPGGPCRRSAPQWSGPSPPARAPAPTSAAPHAHPSIWPPPHEAPSPSSRFA